MESTINSAMHKGYFNQIRFLVEKNYDVNHRDEERRTPIINCAFIDQESWGVGLARMFIEKDANLKCTDKKGLNCMHYACIFERKNLVRIYLDALDFDLNQTDGNGNTALHYAVSTGNAQITRVLIQFLKKYKLPIDPRNKSGTTPLMLAWKVNHEECARALVDADCITQPSEDNFILRIPQNNRPGTGNSKKPRSIHSASKAGRSRPHTGKSDAKTDSRLRQRIMSASLLTRRRRAQEGSSNSDAVGGLHNRDTLNEAVIYTAGDDNLRNKPDYIFQVNPIHYFAGLGEFGRETQNYGKVATMSVSDKEVNWRIFMKQLYNKCYYQFSDTYRIKAALIPEDDGTLSPNFLDMQSEGISPRRLGRRCSTPKLNPPELKRKISMRNRKVSSPVLARQPPDIYIDDTDATSGRPRSVGRRGSEEASDASSQHISDKSARSEKSVRSKSRVSGLSKITDDDNGEGITRPGSRTSQVSMSKESSSAKVKLSKNLTSINEQEAAECIVEVPRHV